MKLYGEPIELRTVEYDRAHCPRPRLTVGYETDGRVEILEEVCTDRPRGLFTGGYRRRIRISEYTWIKEVKPGVERMLFQIPPRPADRRNRPAIRLQQLADARADARDAAKAAMDRADQERREREDLAAWDRAETRRLYWA